MTDNVSLAISIVVYRPDIEVLNRSLSCLKDSVTHANAHTQLRAKLYVVDNSTDKYWAGKVTTSLAALFTSNSLGKYELIVSDKNLGYGRANNLAIQKAASTYHLVMNPDVFVRNDTILNAIRFMENNPSVGLLVPDVRGEKGERHYLCKKNPTLFDMFLRGFAPKIVRKLFSRRMQEFEMRDKNYDEVIWNVEYPTGCFMLFRSKVLKEIGGFDPRFFMYLEDADIGRRMLQVSSVVHIPDVKIVHKWARETHKNWKLRWTTIKSALLYWRKWGGIY
jgi:UDP-N-acetyl-alpha-D-quinovosamine dehydrogenase